MSAAGIPREARDLIVREIHSVAQLELLIYLHARGSAPVTADEAAANQKLQIEMARGLLTDLTVRGFMRESDGSYTYAPSPSQAREVASLADAYGKYRVSIINLIFSKPSDGIQSFADAFRVRKEDE